MAEIERVNGHRPSGLLHLLDPSLKLAPHPQQDEVDFDLETGLSSIVRLSSKVPEDAFSARALGVEREGNAVLLGKDGILVTIGYLVVDAHAISIQIKGGGKCRQKLWDTTMNPGWHSSMLFRSDNFHCRKLFVSK